MKKFVVTILLVLPFILMFIISFAARIITNYQHVYVDSVCFVDNDNVCSDKYINISLNQEYDLKVKVFPELATNKKVTYSVLDKDIISVSESGRIKGLSYGITKVSVKTNEGNMIDELIVKVSDEYIKSIDITIDSITVTAGGKSFDLSDYLIIEPYTALDKRVSWESNDEKIVKVNSNGIIEGLKEGKATITVTTLDGGYSDIVEINVIKFDEPFDKVSYEPGYSIYLIDDNRINLFDLVVIYDNELLNESKFTYEIIASSSDIASDAYIENNVLYLKEEVLVRVKIIANGVEYSPIINLKVR